jgi:hypothetical protein
MDVDETGHDQLAGGVNRLSGARRCDGRLYGGDFAARDRDVGQPVEPARRIDDPAALDQQVVLRGAQPGSFEKCVSVAAPAAATEKNLRRVSMRGL